MKPESLALRAAEDAVMDAEDRYNETLALCYGDRESPAVKTASKRVFEAHARCQQAFRAWLAVEGQ